mgnify:CR=1 FL=1
MSNRAQRRNDVLAGLFLVVALLLAVFISFWVEEGFEKLPFVNPRTEYVARFEVSNGVAGLKPGSPVTLGGLEVGSVEAIEYRGRGADGEPEAIDVQLSVDSEVVLHEDAEIVMIAPLLGSLSVINISDIGGETGAPVLAEGSVIAAGRPGGLANIDGVVSGMQELVNRANEIAADVAPKVGPITDDVGIAIANAREFAESMRINQERWITKADSILDNADGVFRDTLPQVAEEVVGGIGDARRLMGTAQDVLDENRGDIRRSVSNIEGLTTRARYDMLGRVERLMDEGLIAAANMSEIGGRMLATIDRVEPPLNRAMANFQLASGQAVLLIEEIRAAPWRALKEPDEKAKREEVLYSAVRRYAETVERLRDASASLESVLQGARAGGREVDPEQVLDMTTEIKRSFGAYSQAEQDLLSLIARQTGRGGSN